MAVGVHSTFRDCSRHHLLRKQRLLKNPQNRSVAVPQPRSLAFRGDDCCLTANRAANRTNRRKIHCLIHRKIAKAPRHPPAGNRPNDHDNGGCLGASVLETNAVNAERGALWMERLANDKILENKLGKHLVWRTRDRRFQPAFGTGSEACCFLWKTTTDQGVPEDKAEPIQVLWTLLFLKTHDNHENLAARCGIGGDVCRKWRDKMSESPSSLEAATP